MFNADAKHHFTQLPISRWKCEECTQKDHELTSKLDAAQRERAQESENASRVHVSVLLVVGWE